MNVTENVTEYNLKITERGTEKVEIEIGKGDFPLTHFVFKDTGTEGVQISTKEKNGQSVPPDVIEQARKLAIDVMLRERFGG
jgi:hypothetical protein